MNIAVIYIDDIVIPGRDFKSAAANLDAVLGRLERANLKVKTKKCHLFQRRIQLLGHDVGMDGIRPVEAKVAHIREWPIPIDVAKVTGFVGLAGYYRKMIPHFAGIAGPLNALLKKDVPFVWSVKCQKVFDTLKARLCEDPILAYPIANEPFILDTDASNVAAGGVLVQVQGGKEKTIAYWSKSWSKSQRNYSVVQRELLAALLAMENFRYYLVGLKDFTLRTDHQCLRWIKNLRNTDEGLVQRWITWLGAFNFTVEHRPGRNHGNADALSRLACVHCGGDIHPEDAALEKVCPRWINPESLDWLSLPEIDSRASSPQVCAVVRIRSDPDGNSSASSRTPPTRPQAMGGTMNWCSFLWDASLNY